MMESTGHVSVSVPLRAGKKMKKRKELDALVANSITKRSCVTSSKRGHGQAGGGISSQDQLLSESTDDHDHNQEYWIAGAARRPRTRIARKRGCRSLLLFRACSIVLMLVCVLATTTVLWLFIDVREQITALRSELDQVVANSQGVPDALQKCHTISKSLQNNQSLIINEINSLKSHLDAYNRNVTDIQVRLNLIEEKLRSVPEYVNVPQQLKQVSSSIANLGSQIKDITNTVATLKTSKDQLETTTNTLTNNVTTLHTSIQILQNQTQAPSLTLNNAKIESVLRIIDDIKLNLTNINTTLSSQVGWIQQDLKSNKQNVETISNVGQNMSARVSTLEGLCGKSVTQNMLSTNIKGVYDEMKNLTNNIEKQALQMNDIQMQIFQLTQNNSELSTAINALNEAQSKTNSPSSNKLNTVINVTTSTSAPVPAPVPVPIPDSDVDTVTASIVASSATPTPSAPIVSPSQHKIETNPTSKPSILSP